jgi:predicted ATPase
MVRLVAGGKPLPPREVDAACTHAEAVLELARRQEFAQRLAVAMIHRGWALAMQGQSDAGIAEMRQGISAWQATGAVNALPYLLTILAEAYGKGGRPEEGVRVLTEGLAWVDKNEERWQEAELHRLKGELLLALPADHQVEGGSLFSPGPHRRPPPAGEVAGAARRHEPRAALAAAG